MDSDEEENANTWNFKSNMESIQSAYMLVYERRLKNPIKILVDNSYQSQSAGIVNDSETGLEKKLNNTISKDSTEKSFNNNNDNFTIVTIKEGEQKAIEKEYNFLYHYGEEHFKEQAIRIFNTKFFDNSKNESYKYIPFFSVENLVPINYYQEIIEDNNRLEKQQNISDELFVEFFNNVIKQLDESIRNQDSGNNEEFTNKIVFVFMDFIFNILSSEDKIKVDYFSFSFF